MGTRGPAPRSPRPDWVRCGLGGRPRSVPLPRLPISRTCASIAGPSSSLPWQPPPAAADQHRAARNPGRRRGQRNSTSKSRSPATRPSSSGQLPTEPRRSATSTSEPRVAISHSRSSRSPESEPAMSMTRSRLAWRARWRALTGRSTRGPSFSSMDSGRCGRRLPGRRSMVTITRSSLPLSAGIRCFGWHVPTALRRSSRGSSTRSASLPRRESRPLSARWFAKCSGGTVLPWEIHASRRRACVSWGRRSSWRTPDGSRDTDAPPIAARPRTPWWAGLRSPAVAVRGSAFAPASW